MPQQQPQLQPPVQVECTNFTYKGFKNASGKGDFSKGSLPVLFAFGELYCFAVIFGYRRVILPSAVYGEKTLLLSTGAISLCALAENITCFEMSKKGIGFS